MKYCYVNCKHHVEYLMKGDYCKLLKSKLKKEGLGIVRHLDCVYMSEDDLSSLGEFIGINKKIRS